MKINIPENIYKDIKLISVALAENNHSCYLVGGCVRDGLLGKTPKDYDLTTSASTNEVYKALCDKVELIPTGVEFGTWTIVINDNTYEITSFRGDVYDENHGGHHPSNIKEVKTLEEDLDRRDFTINAIAYDYIKDEIIDPHSGQFDLEHKTIRCVGNPVTRFTEDPLRMLRAVRFQAQLGFNITSRTGEAIWHCCELINDISSERIQVELNKILVTDNIHVFNHDCCLNLITEIIPELIILSRVNQNTPWHVYDAYDHSIRATAIVEPELHLRLAMLFHDLGKADTETTDENGIDHFYGHGIVSADLARGIMTRLRYSNEMIDKVCLLIKEHDRRIELSKKAVKKVLNLMGEEATKDLLKIRWADICAQNPVNLKPRAKKVFDLTAMVDEIIASKEPFSRKDLNICGKSLMNLGYEFGPDIGNCLEYLLDKIQESPERNQYSDLCFLANAYLIALKASRRNIESR